MTILVRSIQASFGGHEAHSMALIEYVLVELYGGKAKAYEGLGQESEQAQRSKEVIPNNSFKPTCIMVSVTFTRYASTHPPPRHGAA